MLGRFEEALAVARAPGDGSSIGEALTRVGSQLGALGQTARSRETLAEAARVLEKLPPGLALAGAYAYRAEEEMFTGNVRSSSEFAGRAIAILEHESDELLVMPCTSAAMRAARKETSVASTISGMRCVSPRRRKAPAPS